MRASLLLLVLVPTLIACPSRRGGGGGGGDDDDSAGPSGPTSLAESLDYTSFLAIHPNDAGLALGFTECTVNLSAVVTRDPEVEGCSSCVGVWTGPLTLESTDCSSSNTDPDVTFGFALAEDGLEVWTADSKSGEFSFTGVASSSDGAWRLEQTTLMGEGDLNFGETESVQAWQ